VPLSQWNMYLCQFQTSSVAGYVKHCRLHSNNATIPCGLLGCKQQFKKLLSFYSHIYCSHSTARNQIKLSVLHGTGDKFKCSVQSWNTKCSLSQLLKHMKLHIGSGMKVQCPILGCDRSFSNKSTLAAHFSVKHRSVHTGEQQSEISE